MEWARNNVLLWATDLELVPEEIKNQLSHISFTGKCRIGYQGFALADYAKHIYLT